jgi:endonuclease-3
MRSANGRTPRGVEWDLVFRALSRFYRQGNWRTPRLRPRPGDPFKVLISTVLSHQSRDEATEIASQELFARFPDPEALARASEVEVRRLIGRVGLSASKSSGVVRISRELEARFHGKVPSSYEELLSLPMVGRKTANAVRVFGFDLPGVAVDTHIRRVVDRITGEQLLTAARTESYLTGNLSSELLREANPLLVQHGQNLCRARNPRCEPCPVRPACRYPDLRRAHRARGSREQRKGMRPGA